MLDAQDLLNSIKRAAQEANEASQPSDFCFGKVTSIEPLQILVEQKMTLGAAQLVLTRNVTDFMTLVSIDWQTQQALTTHIHKINGKDSGGDTVDLTSKEADLKHQHELTGTKSIIIHNALQLGDEVILLKRKGGQKYLVLDRVVTAT